MDQYTICTDCFTIYADVTTNASFRHQVLFAMLQIHRLIAEGRGALEVEDLLRFAKLPECSFSTHFAIILLHVQVSAPDFAINSAM